MAHKSNDMAHTKWMCKYHIVFTPKYRRKVIYNQYKESIRDILKQLCSYKGVDILEGELMPDHIHMLVSIPPKMSVSSFMGYLKGKSALMIFDKHANLKYKYGNRHFWAEGYYVSTVGLNEATIRKYIQEQEKQDIMKDKLSVKEYEDPFKGQPVVRCPLKGSDESRAQWLEQSESQRLQALAGNCPLIGASKPRLLGVVMILNIYYSG